MRNYSYGKCLVVSAAVVLSIYGFGQLVGMGQGKEEKRTAADLAAVAEAGEGVVAGEGGEEGETVDKPGESEEGEWREEAYLASGERVFGDALFIGDSRTVGLMEYGNLGEAVVFADSGMSVFKVWDAQVRLADGEKRTLGQILEGGSFGKIYVMLGLNELGYPYESIVTRYRALLDEVRRLQPDAVVFLEANLHVSEKRSSSSDIYNNAGIDRLNGAIREMADGEDVFYLDVNAVFDDGAGNLAAEYTADEAHVLGKYYMDWSRWLAGETARIMEGRAEWGEALPTGE